MLRSLASAWIVLPAVLLAGGLSGTSSTPPMPLAPIRPPASSTAGSTIQALASDISMGTILFSYSALMPAVCTTPAMVLRSFAR